MCNNKKKKKKKKKKKILVMKNSDSGLFSQNVENIPLIERERKTLNEE